MTEELIFKIATREQLGEARQTGQFRGAPIDLSDGFIHFSTANQVAETAAKHFANQDNLLLVAVIVEKLGNNLKWEVSRGGGLFPHLYDTLDLSAVKWARPMPLLENGIHHLPLEQS
ncbi:MAG: DUF952 domain-containing protein [Rhizobiaceae bacterium]